jgi:hypothetical protein
VLPLYFAVFIGFVGYSLMTTVFTPLLLGDGGGLVPASSSTSARTLVLGGLLALYPLAQFFGAPVLGSLSDRFGRRPVLLASLAASDLRLVPRLPDVSGRPFRDGDLARVRVHRLGRGADRARQPLLGRMGCRGACPRGD